jgi:hypothetical protein
MSEDDGMWRLEIRLFQLHPGTRDEFHRISRDGTIPLMRRMGITVVAHGASLNNENGYFLLRAFPSEEQRIAQGKAVYETPEWTEKYDTVVMGMIAGYDTAVLPIAPLAVQQLLGLATDA